MDTTSLIQLERLERDEALRLLACIIFEIQVNWLEKDMDDDPAPDAATTLDRLEALVKHAPPAVMPLVEHLRHHPPQVREGGLYTYSFPFIQWRCE